MLRLGGILSSVGHRVKVHSITPATGKERGDVEIRDYIFVAVDTADRIYEDFSRLLFLHAHREASALADELPEESEQFRFLRAA